MSAIAGMINLDDTPFGTVLRSPQGQLFAMVDSGTDDAGADYAWMLPVDANGIRTGGRRQRLYYGEAFGWTVAEA